MQIETSVNPLSGVTLTPITSITQLTPGSYITGMGFRDTHRVIEVTPTGSLVIQAVPEPRVSASHVHRFDRFRNMRCRCGLSTIAAVALLPDSAIPRAYILTPPAGSSISPLKRLAIYLLPDGSFLLHTGRYIKVYSSAGLLQATNPSWPIILRARLVWSLPPALVELLDAAESVAQVVEGGIVGPTTTNG